MLLPSLDGSPHMRVGHTSDFHMSGLNYRKLFVYVFLSGHAPKTLRLFTNLPNAPDFDSG